MKYILTISLFFFSFLYSQAQQLYRLPKVLFLTTGADKGRGTVSDGIVTALEAFNKLGAFVRLENREVLLQPEVLTKYDILIIPTIKGYHDMPQQYSLTYMTGMELKNIARWVKDGGTLITDVNIGRNTLDGTDRILKDGILNVNNWELGRCFGVALKEINTQEFAVKDTGLGIWKHDILRAKDKEIWRLVPVDYAQQVKILAKWQKDDIIYPAITLNHYGKGNAILLPTFYVLHPDTDGGLSNKKEIFDFYKWVYDTTTGKIRHKIKVSPWKNAHNAAFCLTFDDGGNAGQYQRIFDFVEKNELPAIFFVTPNIDANIIRSLKQQQYVSIQDHSYTHPDFRKLDYFQTVMQFLQSRQFWNTRFKGFRFPYVSNSFWGMYILDKMGYEYESSIAANNMEFMRGSIIPYNIPVFNDQFFVTLDLLEISQIYRSDWYFYKKSLENEPYTTAQQSEDAKRFGNYLKGYFDKVVRPYNGIMVFLGHPMYSGYSDMTLKPLQELVNYLKVQDVWFVSLNEVASRWNKLKVLKTVIKENDDNITIDLEANGTVIEGLTLVMDEKPENIYIGNQFTIKEKNGKYYLIFDLENKETIKIEF